MAVTRDGIPVRCWTFPGTTAAIIRTLKDDLGGWWSAQVGVGGRPRVRLRRPPRLPHPWGRALHPRRETAPYQQRSGRRARPLRALPWPTTCGSGKSTSPPAGTATATTGPGPTGSSSATNPKPPTATPRCVPTWSPTCNSSSTAPTPGVHGAATSWSAPSRPSPAAPLPTPHPGGLLRIDHTAIKQEQHLDGKWLLRTSDITLLPDDLAAANSAPSRSNTTLTGQIRYFPCSRADSA
jgi:hypothetical protein